MSIRSFVLRQGRITPAQERAFERLWPRFGLDEHEDLQAPFGDARPLVLEIGFGNGESLVRMAQDAPELGFLGLEVHRPGVGHALLAIERQEIDNLRLIRGDAVAWLRDHCPKGALSRVQIFFPDPWPKARHHKRRLVQSDFLALVASRLTSGGVLHCATDWAPYGEWMRDLLLGHPDWENLGGGDGFAPRPEWRPETKFERRGRKLGHGVWDLLYQTRAQ